MQETLNETSNSPEYYKSPNGIMEVSDFIDAFELNFNCGNVVKYIVRAGKKDGENRFQGLYKAHNYLVRELVRAAREVQEGNDHAESKKY